MSPMAYAAAVSAPHADCAAAPVIAVAGLNSRKKTADVVLTVTDVRSSEQVAMTEGHAGKTDIGWNAGAGVFWGAFAGAGAGGYANTELGQVVTLAYLQAYTDMVGQL